MYKASIAVKTIYSNIFSNFRILDGARNDERYFCTSKKITFTQKMRNYSLKKFHFPKKYYKLALSDARAQKNFIYYCQSPHENICKS